MAKVKDPLRELKIQWITAYENYGEVSSLLRSADLVCEYCKTRKAETFDHIVPRSKGGDNSPENLNPVCRKCNTDKAAMLPEEWEALCKSRLEGIQKRHG